MQTEAIFNNISYRIKEEIQQATESIYVAVAWFTNKTLFQELIQKAKSGCKVQVIIANDSINEKSYIDYGCLEGEGSKVFLIGNGDSELMHNKFCVIDGKTVITGSYNWSYKAESNFENVVITNGDTDLANQFITEFYNILRKFHPEDVIAKREIPHEQIVKRLEIIKNFIILEDIDDALPSITKLKEYDYNFELKTIINDFVQREYGSCVSRIQNFISERQKVSIFYDPEVFGLKLEIKVLEHEVNAFDNEKTDLLKLLNEYQYRHTKELGIIILELFRLKKLKYSSDKESFSKTQDDEKKYKDAVEDDVNKEHIELSDEQIVDLKKKFRKASTLCHPDKVSDEFKEIAEEIFIELKSAYDRNDLKSVSESLAELEKGRYFKPKSETIQEKDLIRAEVAKLKRKIRILQTDIIALKESESYRTISSLEDWDQHFGVLKAALLQQVEDLKSQLNHNKNE